MTFRKHTPSRTRINEPARSIYSLKCHKDTIYSDMVPLWLYKRPSLIEGLTSFQCKVLVSATSVDRCSCYRYIYSGQGGSGSGNQGRIQDLFIGGVEISSEARDERSERRAKRETSEARDERSERRAKRETSEARDERSERRAKRETSEASKKQLGARGAL